MANVITYKIVTLAPSVYGMPFRSTAGQTFSSIRSGAGTGVTSVYEALLSSTTTSNMYSELGRCIILFDTSIIESGSTIDSVSLFMPIMSSSFISNGLGNTTFEIVSSSPASDSIIAASDYSNLGSTSFASINVSSIVAGNTTTSLNSSGIANINIGGTSQYGMVLGWDLNNSFTGTWASGTSSGGSLTNAPNLIVSYHFSSPSLSIANIGSTISNISSITTS